MEGEGKRHFWCNAPLKRSEINLLEKKNAPVFLSV